MWAINPITYQQQLEQQEQHQEEQDFDEDYPPMEFNGLNLELFPSRTEKEQEPAYEDEDYEVDFEVDLDSDLARYTAGTLAIIAALAFVATRKRK